MKGVIFKKDRADGDLLDRAMNADLDIMIPGIFPSPKPLHVRRGEKLSRADIMRKVAKDLRVTLDEEDGFFIFRFPSVWSAERCNDKMQQIKDGVALVEEKCNNSTMMTPKRDAIILYAMHFAVNAIVSTLSVQLLHFPLIAGIVGCCAGSIAGITGQLMFSPPKSDFSLVVWFKELFNNIGIGIKMLWEGPMFALVAMSAFLTIVALGLFHVTSAEVTGVCFVSWFVVMFACSEMRDPFKKRSIFEERAEPDLENAFPLGKSHLVSPPQGGDATIPVDREVYLNPTVKLMKLIEREIYMRSTTVDSSDNSYDEPRATYPEMTMEKGL